MPRPIYSRLLCTIPFLSAFVLPLLAQSPPASAVAPTMKVTSRLVFLDVTVVDKKGRPVVQGLGKDDFAITEEKRPQRIFSFEEPRTHVIENSQREDVGDAPRTVFVLDFLNTSFADSAYIRYSVRKFLMAQPDQLASPAELMVLGNQSLEMVQGYTRNKEDLLYALDHVPAALPYKFMNAAFWPERFAQSIDALQQIALQNKGLGGRKNIVWVGHGGPGLETAFLIGSIVDKVNRYVRDTVNMLVDSRVSLFVIYPGLKSEPRPAFTLSEGDAAVALNDSDPFAGDVNFGVFVNETGGRLFYNRNDVDREMDRSEVLGSNYYTLTYQPQGGTANGKFRRVRVTLRNPNLRAITKAGYYAPDQGEAVDPGHQILANLAEVLHSTIPFQAVGLTIKDLVRHPDTHTADFTVVLQPKIAGWEPGADGKSTVSVTLTAMSLSRNRDVLDSKEEAMKVTVNSQNANRLALVEARLPMNIRIPGKMQTVRVAVQLPVSGRIGTAELDRRAVDAAPEAPTPTRQLQTRPHS